MSYNAAMYRMYVILSVFLLTTSAAAQGLLVPDPNLSPERVVEIQLSSLKYNDVPVADTGIAQTWVFAHPNNKNVTGPLERFAVMIKGPSYRMLLDHREHSIQPVVQLNDHAIVAVTITTAANQQISYQWELSKVLSGEYEGSWMTTGVSPPILAEDGI